MEKIYLDHAAGSWPKAPGVGERMLHYLDHVGTNMNRASYAAAAETLDEALSLRERLCRLFGFSDPAHVIFTPGQTYSLNFVLHGLLQDGGEVIVSSLEHNAVMRPLTRLKARGLSVLRVPCREDGGFDMEAFRAMLRPGVRLAALTHASNVSGALLPLEAVAALCKEAGVPLLIDAAQTAGHVPISVEGFGEMALAVPGHKGMLGPSGIGALLLSPSLAARMEPLVMGGTGSASDSESQPAFMPDRFESGTPNLPGIYGFSAAAAFIEARGPESLQSGQAALTERFLAGIKAMPGIRVLPAGDARVGVVTCDFQRFDNAGIAYRLEREHGIMTRCGLHCAPAAHRALGSFPGGGVRFSFGYGNAASDIDAALEAIEAVIKA
ncbi:MAG: aminotransferase class V-fold PLP-dependent enzyme [Clostridia bacterium]|nr:aminotransferase class V-fold PLP-dependent enzyme [Clostridia bacterium]